MILSSDPSLHPHMLGSIFKSVGGAAAGLKVNTATTTSTNDITCSIVSISPEKARSISMDSGISLNVKLAGVPGQEAPVDDYVQKTKKTAGYLRLILHSKKCNGFCMKTACIKTSGVIDHMNNCFDARCSYPGCTTSKKLLEHYEKCGNHTVPRISNYRSPSGVSNFCLLCSLVPQANTSPTNRSKYQSPDHSSSHLYAALPSTAEESDRYEEIVYNDHRRSLSALDEHNRESPVIFDEMMEFNKVPFQDAPSEYCRPSLGSAGLTQGVYTEEPPRKIRSKSMNAVCNEFWSG